MFGGDGDAHVARDGSEARLGRERRYVMRPETVETARCDPWQAADETWPDAGRKLAQLMDLQDEAMRHAMANGSKGSKMAELRSIDKNLQETFALLYETAQLLQARNMKLAYETLVNALGPFQRAFREDEDAWLVKPMHRMVKNLRSVAEACDAVPNGMQEKTNNMADAGAQMMKCFAVSIQAQHNRSKKLAALFIVNELFKVYFKLNTLHLCKNLVRAVMAPTFAKLEEFPMAQRVTYMYYVGRLSVFEEKYKDAEQQLEFALAHCDKGAVKNKRRILQYLVPVKLGRGHVPSTDLLQKYQLYEYTDLVGSFKCGSIQAFNQTLLQHQRKFIASGTYLLLEKMKLVVYRTLFKKVHQVHTKMVLEDAEGRGKSTQISMEMLKASLDWQRVSMDLEEIECLVANLIYQGYIKGYLSHQKRTLVVSKQDPFPHLFEVAKSSY